LGLSERLDETGLGFVLQELVEISSVVKRSSILLYLRVALAEICTQQASSVHCVLKEDEDLGVGVVVILASSCTRLH